MKRSFLYPNGVADKKTLGTLCGSIGTRTLYHLSLDRSFGLLFQDDEDQKPKQYFLSVLSQPLIDRDAILYRQEILKDFLGKRSFFFELSDLYVRFTGLRDGHDRERQAMKRMIHATTAGAASGTIMNLLQANALTLKRELLFLKSLSDLFEGTAFLSRGLRELKEAAEAIVRNPAYAEMIQLCGDVENIRPSAPFDITLKLGSGGQVEDCKLIEHKYLHIVDPDGAKGLLGFFKRPKQDNAPASCVRIYQSMDTIFDKITTSPLIALAEGIDMLTDQLFDEFSYIGDELGFYHTAIKYVREMRNRGVSANFPTFTEETKLVCKGLRDLYLVLSYEKPDDVIPNDITMDTTGGIVVFGENGSGKTVYLRSVGTAQLLAQAGLPVPAEIAEMSLRSQIVTQFSEAEKEFEKGNDAGRFEQEVRELASVIDTLDDGALVLLNETFQTTSYEEGAEGLYYILQYFTERGMQWLLVSHLHQLEGFLDRKTVHLFETKPGFKVGAMEKA